MSTMRPDDFVWAVGSCCQVSMMPFDPELLVQRISPPYGLSSIEEALTAYGFQLTRRHVPARTITGETFPCLVLLRSLGQVSSPLAEPAAHPTSGSEGKPLEPQRPAQHVPPMGEPGSTTNQPALRPAILIAADDRGIHLFEAGSNQRTVLPSEAFAARFDGAVVHFRALAKPATDPDAQAAAAPRPFGFASLLPEFAKHKQIWRDVLIASLIIQLVALATPLCTQVVIDKVVVHRTTNTLTVVGIALAIFVVFTALLTWVRQYLVLHTGNRIDAAMGTQVFDHLFRLPTRYVEARSTGVIVARLHAIETVREFLASSLVTLILDCPFVVVFAAIMFYYHATLTVVVLAVLTLIVALSLAVAPLFQSRLNHQFLLGARNQSFVTEFVAGFSTVKTLQLESQLNRRWRELLASYLSAGLRTRQLSNTYNTVAGALEQTMTILVLCVGAWIVMNSTEFTVGMLVAFQMFASRLSGPLLRLVGLWQQFQQARIAVRRLGDIMDAPAEPYSVIPSRDRKVGGGEIMVSGLGFRYAEDRPYLYRDLNLTVRAGVSIAIVGPSGSGKSTLSKLLLGFERPTEGVIRIDGVDIRGLSANELRARFGVVPQETTLFSGTIYDNLQFANPFATFEQIIQATRMAELHAHIESLPKGYETEIGERGVGLSGGQKQRLAIARALLKRPNILIFDEATSNLDASTAESIGKTLNALRGHVTMLFITHQLPSTLKVDDVVRIGQLDTAAERRESATGTS